MPNANIGQVGFTLSRRATAGRPSVRMDRSPEVPVRPFRLSVPAWTGEIFFIGRLEPRERSPGIDMRAGHVNRADQSHGGHIRSEKRRGNDGSDQMSVAVSRDGRGFAVGDAEGGHSLFTRLLYGFDRDPQTLAEADRDQHVFGGQNLDFVLQLSFAPTGRFSVQSQPNQAVGEVVGQRSGKVHADYQNAPG